MDELIEGEDQDDLTLNKLVDILEKEDAVRKKPPVRGDGSSVLVILKDKANEEGLTEEQVTRLVQVGTSKKFTDAVVNQIIKCLIPRDDVTADCVVDLISKMCANKINVNIQVSFLKWLIMVYEWINDKEKVHCLYGMIFLFLDNDALCPYICHLLYSMTRKEDVKPFRLRKLLDLLGKVGQQAHLIGLLSLYKVHAPHVVSVNIPKIKKDIKHFSKKVLLEKEEKRLGSRDEQTCAFLLRCICIICIRLIRNMPPKKRNIATEKTASRIEDKSDVIAEDSHTSDQNDE
ncbi:centromere I isoform X1, partial [Paramuricea clavata]